MKRFFLVLFLTTLSAAMDGEMLEFYRSRFLIPLDGVQAGDYPKGNYVILQNLHISKDSRVTFTAGSIVYCGKQARITVEGTLVSQNVTFKSLPLEFCFHIPDDTKALEWQGIEIGKEGKVKLSDTRIFGSSYGIYSLFKREPLLNSVCFAGNSHYNIYLFDKYVQPEETCFKDTIPYILQTMNLSEKTVIPKCARSKQQLITYGASSLIFLGLTAYNVNQSITSYSRYKTSTDIRTVTIAQIQTVKATEQSYIFGVLASLSLGLFTYSVLF